MKIIFVSHRPFSAFLDNGFRQRVGRILYHFIRSETISSLTYIWWNNEPRLHINEVDHVPTDFMKVFLVESKRLQLPFARTLGLSISMLDRYRVRKLADKLKLMSSDLPWVWATDPRFCSPLRELTDGIGGRLAYDLIDNFALLESLPKEERDLFHVGYKTVVLTADRIFANNHHTGEFFQAPKNKFRCVNSGVDWDDFHAAIGSEDPIDMRNLKHPRVGFVGVLSSVTDTHLLNRVAREIPRCEIVYIGPRGAASYALDERIHCLGEKPYQIVPQYIASLDVGLSIYRQCPATKFGDSQKVYEYLSAGIPVVATSAQDHGRISPDVSVASGDDEFVHLVRDILAEPDRKELREARSQSVRAFDWRYRIKEIFDFLEETGK